MRYTKIFLSLILSALTYGAGAQNINSRNNVIDEVIWIVGDEAILKSDVEDARIEAMAMGQKIVGDPYCVIPEQLAVQKLFLNQAAIDSVEVSDGDVYQEVNSRIDHFVQEYGSKEKVEEYAGKSISQLREQLFNSIRDNEMVRQVRESLVKNIKAQYNGSAWSLTPDVFLDQTKVKNAFIYALYPYSSDFSSTPGKADSV